jgi:hypothetical protein
LAVGCVGCNRNFDFSGRMEMLLTMDLHTDAVVIIDAQGTILITSQVRKGTRLWMCALTRMHAHTIMHTTHTCTRTHTLTHNTCTHAHTSSIIGGGLYMASRTSAAPANCSEQSDMLSLFAVFASPTYYVCFSYHTAVKGRSCR